MTSVVIIFILLASSSHKDHNDHNYQSPGALEGCSGPKKVGKRETMEEDGAHRQAPPPAHHHDGHQRDHYDGHHL